MLLELIMEDVFACKKDTLECSSKNLPKIYPNFYSKLTQDLPKITAYLVFYLLKTYPRFTQLTQKHLGHQLISDLHN